MLSASSSNVLEKGDEGAEVRRLQAHLKSLGFEVSVDGQFYSETEEKLREFQESEGLTVDGLLGNGTRTALDGAVLRHKIQHGDTLWGLAEEYGTTVEVLKQINLKHSSRLNPGQELLVPRAGYGGGSNGLQTYRVRPGDSLWKIANRFNTTRDELVRLNELENPDSLSIDQELRVPATGQPGSIFPLEWPLPEGGRISSGFGYRENPMGGGGQEFHGGVDIAVPTGTPVYASATGVVIDSGWMGASGNAVILDHGQDIKTSYIHNQTVLVEAGQRVNRGQLIARSGSTGRSTGPHLDFKVRIDGDLRDPMDYLDVP